MAILSVLKYPEKTLSQPSVKVTDINDDIKKLIKDMEFHMTLASLSGQYIRVRSLKTIFELLHLKYRNSLQYVTIEHSDKTEHGRIFDAVIDRKTDLAAKYLAGHISHSRKHAVLNLSRMIEEKEDFPF